MIPLDEVQAAIIASIGVLDVTECDLADALGLVLGEEIVAAEPVPPFANTAMDGYAVRAADTAGASENPRRLEVVGDLPAGRAPSITVGAGEAIRIMTGAPMPDGADAIVIVERTERADDGTVIVHEEVKPGQHVRRAGGDLERGDVVFVPGAELTPARVGVLATVGAQRARVVRRARVGVLSTGDELVESGPLAPGKIRDSNRAMLLALLARAGAEPVDLGLVRDDEDAMTSTLEEALARCDVVITSGGVSVGDYDYVSAVLERIAADDPSPEARVDWYQVAIKPAKPLCFAHARGTPVFGLPGNPVSSLVSFELFARPSLRKMMGHERWYRDQVRAVAAEPMPRKRDGKLHLDRVVVRVDDGRYMASGVRSQESNALAASAAGNALALLPDGDGAAAGDDIMIMLLD